MTQRRWPAECHPPAADRANREIAQHTGNDIDVLTTLLGRRGRGVRIRARHGFYDTRTSAAFYFIGRNLVDTFMVDERSGMVADKYAAGFFIRGRFYHGGSDEGLFILQLKQQGVTRERKFIALIITGAFDALNNPVNDF